MPGVALIQVLVPALIKRQFAQRVALALGVYSASLMAGGGLAALVSPLAGHFGHWQAGLGIWLAPALVALVLWGLLPLPAVPGTAGEPAMRPWRNRRAWLLALYFRPRQLWLYEHGGVAFAYYLQMG